jgi:hypothetical protein
MDGFTDKLLRSTLGRMCVVFSILIPIHPAFAQESGANPDVSIRTVPAANPIKSIDLGF